MKLNEIFYADAGDLGVNYYSSSFSGDKRTNDQFKSNKNDQAFQAKVNVSHVNIDGGIEVNLIKNAKVIKTDSWDNIIAYLKDNFSQLRGNYKITRNQKVLHSFRV